MIFGVLLAGGVGSRMGNVAKGYLTFDNGRLYVNIKTKTKAEGAKVHPSVDTVMIKG